jgi:chaperonin GroES
VGTTVEPTLNRVVIRPDEKEEVSDSGLIIPEIAGRSQKEGTVVAVGPGKWEKGQRTPMQCSPGDRVIYAPYLAYEIRVDHEKLFIFDEPDLLGIRKNGDRSK